MPGDVHSLWGGRAVCPGMVKRSFLLTGQPYQICVEMIFHGFVPGVCRFSVYYDYNELNVRRQESFHVLATLTCVVFGSREHQRESRRLALTSPSYSCKAAPLGARYPPASAGSGVKDFAVTFTCRLLDSLSPRVTSRNWWHRTWGVLCHWMSHVRLPTIGMLNNKGLQMLMCYFSFLFLTGDHS